ncbi:UbiA family prenyltransferase [Solimicrobium silvestre]|uniref:UbiA prenyltransferase family n=1 Tax=Solimicrobium silvestre TaxID=2099400 RepID=A0A2S9H0C0_9BURK|nr:UbiA family prenyltransferase [Solimicrobium silvestre]PRC93429.1 UbiA prenyltransferase family [Solimicrobium silvestre]
MTPSHIKIIQPSVFLRLGRVSNLPTIWSNALAGTMLSGATLNEATANLKLFWVMLALTAFYVAGMYLNDAFDAGFDAKNRIRRPIPSGEISRFYVFTIGYFLLGIGVFLLARYGNTSLVCGVSLAFVIVLYNIWHKGNPASPLLMGVCRMLVYFAAASCANGGQFGLPLLLGAVALFSHIVGLTYAAKQEAHNQLGQLWPLMVLALPVLYYAFTVLSPQNDFAGHNMFIGLGLVAALITSNALALRHLLRPAQLRAVPAAVTQLIATTSILDALAVYSMGASISAILFCLAAYVLTRLLQTVIAGT